MAFLDRVLLPPSYGFVREGRFYAPGRQELWREFLGRINVFRSRKQWLPAWSWFSSLALLPFLAVFLGRYFNAKLLVIGVVYSMVVLGTHGTEMCIRDRFRTGDVPWNVAKCRVRRLARRCV